METVSNQEMKSTRVMTGKPKIIAIDGPAGSGKSTISSKIAKQMGWSYINTGAIYRAVGLIAVEADIDIENESQVVELVSTVANDLVWDGDSSEIFYKGRNLTGELRSEKAGYAASVIAKQEKLRESLLPVQRKLAMEARSGAILDGRDIGTVVFPNADVKIFLTASLEERAKRRLRQLGESCQDDLASIQSEMATRDERDASRDAAPLKKADDAIEFDSSSYALDEVVDNLLNLIRSKIN